VRAEYTRFDSLDFGPKRQLAWALANPRKQPRCSPSVLIPYASVRNPG
jgi:hypothetical protein